MNADGASPDPAGASLLGDDLATERLLLCRPRASDVGAIYGICGDARLWQHFPSRRHTTVEQSQELVQRWVRSWEEHGLGPWIVREPNSEEVIGYGGCELLSGTIWNLGYRLAFRWHGQGLATELGRATHAALRDASPHPVVAYMVEHNDSSWRVARKIGLRCVHRGPDAGNPDRTAVRLVFSDRSLNADQLQVAML